ncbi:MAG: pyrroline-5-carboxylate reductase [Deltaproteobacteria bacterium]|nr:pyrroline-5-carboxylate reductase [Deltaproteobacteria bacterium]MBW2723817.1 pyrroline-5-carboxylate reductase [Deltaproteobacteria bacterium]
MSKGIESLSGHKIGFIGCGAMAQALAGGLIAAGVPATDLRGADLAPQQRKQFEAELGISATANNDELVASCDVLVVCVKPNVVGAVLSALDGSPGLDQKLWISLAAGIGLGTYGRGLPDGTRVVRSMPNTPALVGEGATALCPNAHASAADLEIAEALFSAVGTTWITYVEDQMDAVTGLSGSGPAYVFLILEALGDAGVREGLPRDAAYRLALQTVLGAAKLAIESGEHPGVLKDRVTSPGGTTIAGLEKLEAAGVRAAIYDAVAAATARSKELGS